ncbi:adenylate/guanylate cyclase domain-containing protein [Afifella sp. YEN Y35]|uniref:adenylate/guanylate cyclase domain-containing protein n=1 Tax=Afifella sp. YEN Y35 TaxID=3388337 RepID=UPI0039E05456
MSRTTKALPPGLKRRIDELDERAEIRIGWAQLALIVFFGSAYAFLPRAEGSAGFNFVPYALAAYAVFTVLRLGLAYRRRLGTWLIVASIVFDVALLTAIIFSYHVQYDEPAAFVLKSPTVLYFFLFIALRALRFDPTFLILTGALAVASWVSLVIYAIYFDPDFAGITRNYVEYTNGSKVLVGAELDKIIVISATTFLLAYVLMRSRALLVSAVRDHVIAGNLSRFFAPEIARNVGEQEPTELVSGVATTRDIAALFIDIRGFTALAEAMQPSDVMALLTGYQSAMATVIGRFNGHIDKYLGDGILATFGAVDVSPCYAADALHAAFGVYAAVDVLNEEMAREGRAVRLRVGCAVAAGSALVGVVGGAERLEHTVIGVPVNLAAKLEDANRVEGTAGLTTRSTLKLAKRQGFVTPQRLELRRKRQVAGLSGSVDLIVLKSAPMRAETAPITALS